MTETCSLCGDVVMTTFLIYLRHAHAAIQLCNNCLAVLCRVSGLQTSYRHLDIADHVEARRKVME